MTINWQAKDSKGTNINCSITVEIDSSGIKRVVNEPKFGEITIEEVLKLVEQNKEVFINGKTLYQAFTDMGKSVNDQQTPAEEIFTKGSPQSPTSSSSGYSSPDSRRNSVSISSEFGDEDEIFESGTFSDKEEHKQEEGLEKRVAELEKENTYLKRENSELKNLDTRIIEEGEKYRLELEKSEEEVRRFEAELERKTNELAEKDQNIERLEQKVNTLEKNPQDKNNAIESLKHQLKDKDSKIQSTNRINEELRKKLEQSETELSALEKKNINLENDLKKILVEGLKDNHEKQLAEQLMKTKKEKEELTDTVKQLAGELNQLQKEKEDLERKIRQLEPGRSLADEMSEVNTNEEIDKLKQQLKAKEGMLTHTQEELKSVKDALEQLQDILQQEKYQAAISTQTEVEYESRGIQASDHETTVLKTQGQGTQTKNAGVDVSSPTDQREAKGAEVQTDLQMKDSYDLYDIKSKHIKTTFKNVNVAPAKATEKSTPSK